jgi:hypothetical protein
MFYLVTRVLAHILGVKQSTVAIAFWLAIPALVVVAYLYVHS